MPARSPTLQRRRLGMELRLRREQAGKTIEEVAKALECSHSKVSRIETGQVRATPRDVRDMLDLYGVERDQRDALVEAARNAQQRSWWQAYSDTPSVPLVGLEAAADQIRAYEVALVPGLLQTSDYARAVIRAALPYLPSDQIERRIEVRMARQALLGQDDPPEFSAILEESVLRRPVGGVRVMREQLHRLAEAAAQPTIGLQVLPLTLGEHAGMWGSFTLYCFSDRADPDVVYLEHPNRDLYLDGAEEVKCYALIFESIRAAALSRADSIAFLATLAQEL